MCVVGLPYLATYHFASRTTISHTMISEHLRLLYRQLTELGDRLRRDPVLGGVAVLTAALFAIVFAKPIQLLLRDWWSNPEAGHGLLLGPLAIGLAWKAGVRQEAKAGRWLGGFILLAAVVLRYASDLASELFVMRASILVAATGLIVWLRGVRQVTHWWLPATLLALSIPLPEVVLSSIALPLQFTASRIGAALLEWRSIPVALSGNVIRIPGHELFVAEACSGLRSLTALISLGVLLGAMLLGKPLSRALLIALTIPVAIVLNGVRIFLTGFLVRYVDPSMGEGFMHLSEGLVMFAFAFLATGAIAWVLGKAEARWQGATASI